jgi:tight adherence protein C
MTVALALAGIVLLVPSTRPVPERVPADQDVLLLAELVGLGLGSGMNLLHSLEWASRYSAPALRQQVRGTLRRARLHGLASELRSTDGLPADLFGLLARAVETGAALGPVVDGFIDQLATQIRLDAAARAQRLPVKLLFPLALLMLPGLVLMVAGPALIDVFSRLSAIP